MNEATDVSIACYRGAGTMAISEKAPFERRFRDAMSASQHLQGMWPHAEMVGRHLIGAENVVQFRDWTASSAYSRTITFSSEECTLRVRRCIRSGRACGTCS